MGARQCVISDPPCSHPPLTTPSSSPTPLLPFLQMCLLRPPPPSPCRPPRRPCRPPPPRPPPPPCPTPPVPSLCIFWKGKFGGLVVRPGYETRTLTTALASYSVSVFRNKQCKIRKIDFKPPLCPDS